MELQIENIISAYNTADENGKNLLRTMFPNVEFESDKQAKKRPVTERIKTFEDALKELGDKHPFVLQYKECFDNYLDGAKNEDVADIVAYLKLRIIAAALNEGWTPQFAVGERRWFPWFVLYTQDEINRMDKEQRGRVVYWSGRSARSSGGVAYAAADHALSAPNTSVGSRLAFKTENVARYAGKQFLDIWADFNLIRK